MRRQPRRDRSAPMPPGVIKRTAEQATASALLYRCPECGSDAGKRCTPDGRTCIERLRITRGA